MHPLSPNSLFPNSCALNCIYKQTNETTVVIVVVGRRVARISPRTEGGGVRIFKVSLNELLYKLTLHVFSIYLFIYIFLYSPGLYSPGIFPWLYAHTRNTKSVFFLRQQVNAVHTILPENAAQNDSNFLMRYD